MYEDICEVRDFEGIYRVIMSLAWIRSIKRDSIQVCLFWERISVLRKQIGFFKIVKGTR